MKNLINVLRIAIVLTCLVAGFLPAHLFGAQEIIVSKVDTLVMEKGADNFTITVKAFVKNMGDSGDIVVELVGRDINGYELGNITLNGFIKQGKTKVLVGLIKMSKESYQNTVRWEKK